MNAVGVGDRRYKLSGFKPIAIEHGLAGIGGAHDDIRAFNYRVGIVHRFDINLQRFRHFLREPIAMLPRGAVNFDFVYRTDTTDSG